MCGIVAYLGKKVAQPILIEGLKRLEYRGYDSAGVALLGRGGIRIIKNSGRSVEYHNACSRIGVTRNREPRDE